MNGRWWEYYTVRYLVGSIVEAVAILYLGKYSGSPFSEHVQPLLDLLLLESDYFPIAIALAVLGFAFCYIASSPILVFHACRAYIHCPKLRERWKKFSKVRQIVVVIVITVTAMAYIIFIYSNYLPLLTTILIFLVFFLQIALLIFAWNDRFKTIKTFYENLAKKRAKSTNTREKSFQKEYITSYRHLREHGNAMGIIVLEVILAYALANLPSISCAVVVLVLWMIPGVFAWIIGTELEFHFIDLRKQWFLF